MTRMLAFVAGRAGFAGKLPAYCRLDLEKVFGGTPASENGGRDGG